MKILIHRSVYGLVDEFFYVIENYFVMFLLHKKRSARMRKADQMMNTDYSILLSRRL